MWLPSSSHVCWVIIAGKIALVQLEGPFVLHDGCVKFCSALDLDFRIDMISNKYNKL